MATTVALERDTGRGLSATWLKYFACFSMLVDHFALILDPMMAVSTPDTLLYYLPRYFGRLAFPIFIFFLAEGCRKTRNMPDYLRRLFLFAILIQIPFSAFTGMLYGNVIITMFLSAASIYLYEQLRKRTVLLVALLPAFLLAAFAQLIDSDYGWVGVLTGFLVYQCKSRGGQLATLCGCMLFFYWILGGLWSAYAPAITMLIQGIPPASIWSKIVAGLSNWLPFSLPHMMLQGLFACCAAIPLAFYRGRQGGGNKWFFYIFYPAHLVCLYLIAMCIG